MVSQVKFKFSKFVLAFHRIHSFLAVLCVSNENRWRLYKIFTLRHFQPRGIRRHESTCKRFREISCQPETKKSRLSNFNFCFIIAVGLHIQTIKQRSTFWKCQAEKIIFILLIHSTQIHLNFSTLFLRLLVELGRAERKTHVDFAFESDTQRAKSAEKFNEVEEKNKKRKTNCSLFKLCCTQC